MAYTKEIAWLAALLCCLAGCDSKRPFEWTPELKVVTNQDLYQWLRGAPFEGYWDPQQGNSDAFVITNIDEVFPFIGKLKNADGDFYEREREAVYQSQTMVFKDPQWGESVVYAMLLYDYEEFFLKGFYATRGNVALHGLDAINQSYSARLVETATTKSAQGYKSGIYWVMANRQKYLMGYCQKGRLVFQVAFPCKDEAKGLQKLRETNAALRLGIDEWDEATEAGLAASETPTSFWKDPYTPMYRHKFIPKLKAPLKTTPYKAMSIPEAGERGADYCFAYQNGMGNHLLCFSTQAPEQDFEAFEALHQDKRTITAKGYAKTLYVTKEQAQNGIVQLEAKTYAWDGKMLAITAEYPEADTEAKAMLEGILARLRFGL